MMESSLVTAGEPLAIRSSLEWVSDLIAEGAGGELRPPTYPSGSVRIAVEDVRRPFATSGWSPLTRGAWARNGEVVVENACTAGFDVHVRCEGEGPSFTFRWRPPPRDRLAARVLRSRAHLLARAVLMQYPALWSASLRGRVPLHASACTSGARTPLVSGASGVGRSTLIGTATEVGALTTGDNLAVGDGDTVWGLVEPSRIEGGGGRRMPHGRREAPVNGRIDALRPDVLVVLERGEARRSSLADSDPVAAARSLVTSTYMAGELRRYWAFAATLSAGTGMGPPHPPITDVASAFASRLRCVSLTLGSEREPGLSELLSTATKEVRA